jgi:hypothetical protein
MSKSMGSKTYGSAQGAQASTVMGLPPCPYYGPLLHWSVVSISISAEALNAIEATLRATGRRSQQGRQVVVTAFPFLR